MDIDSAFKDAVKQRGFDICVPFKVSCYNSTVPLYPLPDLVKAQSESETSVAYVIGTTFTFWDKFIKHLRSNTSLRMSRSEALRDEKEAAPCRQEGSGVSEQDPAWHPIDEYCQFAIEEILNSPPFSNIRSEVRYSWYSPSLPDKYVHIQTAAHVSGEFYYDKETFWCGHPTYGLWFALRVVVVLDIPYTRSIVGKIDPPPSIPPVLSVEVKEEMKRLTEIARQEGWKNSNTLLKIRDACPIGRDYRYPSDQLDYFYPKEGESKRKVLLRLLDL